MTSIFLFCFIIYFVSHFSESSSANNENQPKRAVCVIGGGISGVNLGILLQERGYDVHVFEKRLKVGGKIDTFTIRDEVLVELCPLFYDTSDTILRRYIDQFELTSVRYDQADRVAFDPNSGTVLTYPSLNAQQQAAIQQYMIRRSQYINELDFGYLQATPDLFDPASRWLNSKNLTALTPLFQLLLTVEGYGSLQDTSALYMLKYVSNDLLMSTLNLSGSFFTLKEGLSVLVHKMASLLKNLYVNHELIALIRNDDHQILYLKNNFSIRRHVCSKTILAFPPLLSNLKKIILSLNSYEQSILNQVKIAKYASAAHHLPPLNHNVYGEAFTLSANNTPIVGEPIGNGELVGLVKQSSMKMQNVYSSYSWIRGDYDTMPSHHELREMSVKMGQTLQKISTAPKTLHKIKASEYFPHAEPKNLKNGFYQRFDSIQGNKGLYYASTILTFEKMNEALKMTESFVERFFNTSLEVTRAQGENFRNAD